jgi:SAM-dependent methyltransferase
MEPRVLGDTVPPHWSKSKWEQKAQEDPMFAVMTDAQLSAPGAAEFTEGQLKVFFAKGQRLFADHVAPLIAASPDTEGGLVVDYGCGMGRVLRSVAAAGHRCAGIDISPTMLSHCRRLNPDIDQLYPLNWLGRSALPSGSASVVYSFAVLQHIATLSAYRRAVAEACRALKPGGMLGLHVNCEDYIEGDLEKPDRTENFERHSQHYRAGSPKTYKRHPQNHWSGVYIGEALMTKLLARGGVDVERRYFHNPKKLRAVWFVGRKRAAPKA